MQVIPKTVSQSLASRMFEMMLIHISRKVLPVTWMLKMSFICDVTMIRATAEVKPDETGPDTKSMMKPETN